MAIDRRITAGQIDQSKNLERTPRRSRTLILWGGGLYSLSFDAVTEVMYHRTSEVSRFPVEDGFVYTDHVMANPLEIRIRGHVSNEPVAPPLDNVEEGVTAVYGEPEGYQNWIANNPYPQVTPGAPSGRLARNLATEVRGPRVYTPTVLTFKGGSPNRIVNVFDQLQTFVDKGELLTIQTRFQAFENMVISNLDAEHDRTTGSGAKFLLEMVQIIIASDVAAISGGSRRKPVNKKDTAKDDKGGDTKEVAPHEKLSFAKRTKNWILGDKTYVLDDDFAPTLTSGTLQ